jgi:ankyrin repeat protein
MKLLIGKMYLDPLLDEEALMIASGCIFTYWCNRDPVFEAITPLHSLRFYEDISSLFLNSFRGYLFGLRDLLATGTPLDVQDGQGKTALSWACLGGCFSAVKELLKHRSVKFNTADIHGMTALMIAAQMDQAEMVRVLLENGADKTLLDNKERTAEEIARSEGHYALATYIKEFRYTSVGPIITEDGLPDPLPVS